MNDKNMKTHLANELSQIIEEGKQQIAVQVNYAMTMVYWQVGKRINAEVLQHERAEYAKEIVSTVSTQLKKQYGRSLKPAI